MCLYIRENHPEIEICVCIYRTPKYYVAIRYNSLAMVFLFRVNNTHLNSMSLSARRCKLEFYVDYPHSSIKFSVT